MNNTMSGNLVAFSVASIAAWLFSMRGVGSVGIQTFNSTGPTHTNPTPTTPSKRPRDQIGGAGDVSNDTVFTTDHDKMPGNYIESDPVRIQTKTKRGRVSKGHFQLISNTGGLSEITIWIRMEDASPSIGDVLTITPSALKWKVLNNHMTSSFNKSGLQGITLSAIGVSAHDLRTGSDSWGRSTWTLV